MTRSVAATLCLTLASVISNAGIQAPVSGYVKDSRTGTLRPINGLPGGSMLGAPISLPFIVDQVQVCAARDLALAVAADDAKSVWLLRGFQAGNVTAAKLDGASADRIALNVACTAGLLYSQASASLQILTGLPDQPSFSDPLSLSGLIGGLTAMALSADGTMALVTLADPSGGGVYLLTPGAPGPQLIASCIQPTAVRLFDGDNDAVVADAATSEVFAIRGFQTSQLRQHLLGASDGIQIPAAIQVLGDQSLFVADAGSNTLVELNLATGAIIDQLSLSGTPTRIDLLGFPDVYALTDAGPSQLLLLDTSRGRNVFFVPLD